MKYLTVQEVACIGPGPCDDRLDPLMEALLALEEADEAIIDPDLAADISTGRVDAQMTVEADDPAAAMVKALAALPDCYSRHRRRHAWMGDRHGGNARGTRRCR
jgi:hypothetical protein